MKPAEKIWRYSLFQIPAILLGIFLAIALILFVLPLPCPSIWRWLSLGLAGISLAWALTLPFDRILQTQTQLTMSLAGRLALFNAFFWTGVIASLILAFLPSMKQTCLAQQPLEQALETVTLDWAVWHANVWNELFYQQETQGEIGSKADFEFVIFADQRIEDIQVDSTDRELDAFVKKRIQAIDGSPALTFIPSTLREQVPYKSNIVICQGEGCGNPADPSNYNDIEEYTQ